MTWSEEQERVFEWCVGLSKKFDSGGTPHLIVRARAGSGKTTTILEGINRAPEDSIQLCAFSRAIADTLIGRVTNPNAQAGTVHGIGMRAIGRRWRGVPVAQGLSRASYLTSLQVKPSVPRGVQWLVSMLHTKGRDMLPTNPTLNGLIGLAYSFDLTPAKWYEGDYPIEWIADVSEIGNERPEPRGIAIPKSAMIGQREFYPKRVCSNKPGSMEFKSPYISMKYAFAKTSLLKSFLPRL